MRFGLWERRSDCVKQWSRGTKQKLAVARALLHHPEMVFLDEPTAGLDVMAANDVRHDLASLVHREGATVFLTTHNMTEAETLCSQIAVVRRGVLMAFGSPDELKRQVGGHRVEIHGRSFSEPAVQMLRARREVTGVMRSDGGLMVDLEGDVAIADLVSALVNAGAAIAGIHKGKATLEDAFMAYYMEGKE